MKSLRLTIAALATAAIAITASNPPSVFAQGESLSAAPKATSTAAEVKQTASPFGSEETDQSPFILVANPTSRIGGRQNYGLMIIEQKAPSPPCFSTTGSSPTQVNPLLAQMDDFSGICGRSTDTNGYLLRAADSDIRYDPVLRNEDGVLVLYAVPRRSAGQNAERFIIGQTDGIAANGFTQIFLAPGWRLTRQTYNGSTTGRTYLTNDLTVAELSGQEVVVQPGGGDQSGGGEEPGDGTPTAPESNFTDIARDIYRNEINRAVQLGFIAGINPTTFGPTQSLTREQIVSIVVEGLDVAPQGTVTDSGFSDVPASRWSAAKIKRAQELNIVTGDGNGIFRPEDEVTRAELIAIMRRAAEYRNNTTTLAANQTGETFTDIDGHWANTVINDLSGYCGIATALNETGNSFYPNQPAKRNYAAAAMVRLLDCTQANTPAADVQ